MQKQSVLSDEREAELWRAWTDQRDLEARRALIDHYLPFANMLAAKLYAGRQVQQLEFHDYRQFAIVGMMEAVDRFDASRNVSFKTYAGHRINGSVLNGVEKSCEKQQQITARAHMKRQRLESIRQDHKEGTGKDLFAELAEVAIGLALGYMLEDSGMYQPHEEHYTENFYDRHELSQLKKLIERIVDILPEQSRSVICYHYYQGLNFEEIAKTMSLSKGRISQVHRQALKLLREIYSGAEGVNLRM
jgi:RNA polymerase sigma factor for flagellar operon FliA